MFFICSVLYLMCYPGLASVQRGNDYGHYQKLFVDDTDNVLVVGEANAIKFYSLSDVSTVQVYIPRVG